MLTRYRMEWSSINHDLRTPILCSPRDHWTNREALRNRHFRCRKVRLGNHLCFLPRRLHRPKTFPVSWNHHPIRLHALHRRLSDSSSLYYARQSSVCDCKTRRNRSYCFHLLLRRWLGFGLELNPISHWRRDLSPPCQIPGNIYDHVFPFREPIRKL